MQNLNYIGKISKSFIFSLSAAICAALLVFCCAGTSSASVLPDDEIFGNSVQSRQLSISQCPDVDAAHAILVDSLGNTMFVRDADSAANIASITKIMTALVALDYVDLSEWVTVSENAAEIGESSANLQAGDSLDMESALKALLVPSGNDAAIAIAEFVGAKLIKQGGDYSNLAENGVVDPVDVFVSKMNEKASALGCKDTLFENPHGLDDEQYEGDLHSTASDVALFSQAAMGNETIKKIVSGGSTTIEVFREGDKEQIDLETTDLLLDRYEYATGIKTGSTLAAGPCFSGSAERNGVQLFAVILDSSSEDRRFDDAQNLFTWYFEHMVDYRLINSKDTVQNTSEQGSSTIPLVAHVSHADWIDVTVPATLSDVNASVRVFDLNGNVSQNLSFDEIHGSIKQGDKLGVATFSQYNEEIASYDIVAAADVKAPNIFQSIGIWFKRLFSFISGKPTVAESTIVNEMPLINDKRAYS